jgi:nucleoside-diphosphate kinase
MLERTLAIIKPDAMEAGNAGLIIDRIIKAGFRITALKMLRLSTPQAEGFYHVHRDKPFFRGLVQFMTSGPVITMILEQEGAIALWRNLMGPTDSAKAPQGTIRGDFGKSIERNAVHGSDASETARFEISHMFAGIELL